MASEIMKVWIDELREFLIDNESHIDYVCLTWIWEETATLDSSFVGRVNGCLQPLYHKIVYDRIDVEYSFVGNVEDAIEFAGQNDCWDGQKLEFKNGIVTGEAREEGSEYNSLWDLYKDGMNIKYIGLVYYFDDLKGNCRTTFYNGEPERVKND